MLALVLDHLWQSTVLALGLGVLAFLFRKASAAVRHGLWLSASAKFLIPFAALAMLGRLIGPAIPLPVEARPEAAFIRAAAQPFSPPAFPVATPPQVQIARAPDPPATPRLNLGPNLGLNLGLILLAVWALGSAAMLAVWAARWSRLCKVVRSARRLDWSAPMPVLAAPSLIEPGLVGLWRPVLLVPETLPERLSRPEIDALLAHEACHLRRRDNLLAALHMLVEAVFWFHPLVWLIGARLIEERERACDEAVLRAGHDRAAYARSLVEICRLYLQSPLDCVAGASGSDLKTRVEAIMHAPLPSPLSRAAKALLLAAGAGAFATPVMAGLLTTPEVHRAVSRAASLVSRALPIPLESADGPTAKPVVLAQNTPVLAPSLSLSKPDVAASPLAQTVADPGVTYEDTDSASPQATTVPGSVAVNEAKVREADSAIRQQFERWTPAVSANPGASEKAAVSDFIQSFAGTLWNRNQVCIWVDGPDEAKADQVKARVDADARAAGMSVERACSRWQAQISIRFAADAGRAVDEVLNNHGHPIWPFPMDRPTGDRPIQAWYGLVYDFAGAPDGRAANLGSDPSAGKKLDLAIVVIDPRRTQGLSLDAVADYAALLALSQPRALDRCNVLPSITDLYAGACPRRSAPPGLTAADAAYLKALYTGSPGIRATRYRSELVDHMARLLGVDARAAL